MNQVSRMPLRNINASALNLTTATSYVGRFDELFETHLWHLFERLCFKCSHTVNVSNLFHGLPTEE